MEEMLNKEATNEQPFRVFKTQEDFDNFSAHLIKKAEEKAVKSMKADLEVSIRAEIEKQAKMSEAEKLENERREMEAVFREERIEINKEKARNLLEKAGFENEEMDVYLDFVTDDRDVSLGKIMRVCESRKAHQEKLHSKWHKELHASNPNVSIGKAQTISGEQARNMSIKERTELKRNNPSLYESIYKK